MRALQDDSPQLFANWLRERNVADNAAPEEGVGERLFRPIQKLVRQYYIARFVFCLERTDSADTDNPGNTEFLHRPNIGAMIEFGRQDAMTSAMPWQKYYLTPCQRSREQMI